MNEFGAVSPNTVGGISEGHASGVAGIPRILGETRLLCRGFGVKGRQWWTAHELTPCLMSALGSLADIAAHLLDVHFGGSSMRDRSHVCNFSNISAACRRVR